MNTYVNIKVVEFEIDHVNIMKWSKGIPEENALRTISLDSDPKVFSSTVNEFNIPVFIYVQFHEDEEGRELREIMLRNLLLKNYLAERHGIVIGRPTKVEDLDLFRIKWPDKFMNLLAEPFDLLTTLKN